MYSTTKDMSETVRAEIAELCNASLAEVIDLQMQCKFANWNVKGPNATVLKRLFVEIKEAVEGYGDLIAERAVQLGGIADCTAYVVPTWEHLGEFGARNATERNYLETLAAALASFGKKARQSIDTCGERGDAVSADNFTEILRGVDKWIRMLEARLQTGAAKSGGR
jgi:starvation-inducible DNA-binding protein